jgi:hypothetical protein
MQANLAASSPLKQQGSARMASDQIRYDLLTQQALRAMVRDLLADIAKKGLPGDHHFFISFDTLAEGVKLSQRMRAQYPNEMTVVLQHQFWDLAVFDDRFEVGLSFNGIPERLSIPLAAIKGFFDPSVQFGLQFEVLGEGSEAETDAPAAQPADAVPADPAPASLPSADISLLKPVDAKVGTKAGPKASVKANASADISPVSAKTTVPTTGGDPDTDPDKPSGGGGEVVRLDRFRKK